MGGALHNFRQQLHRQLDPEGVDDGGISALNMFILCVVIVAVVLGLLATEPAFLPKQRALLSWVEQAILVIFTVELAARFWVSGLSQRFQGLRGAVRFGTRWATITDFIVILPLFLDVDGGWLTVFRVFRVVRLFQLTQIPAASRALRAFRSALRSHWFELAFTAILGGGLLLGSSVALYLIEGRLQPDVFGSVPRAIWWSVVTFTTVGYGDAVPITPLGRMVAGFHAIAGLAVIAMFTGIVASSLTETAEKRNNDNLPPPKP
ncbi:MAG: ion transporter [Pseudomonadota bacterium]